MYRWKIKDPRRIHVPLINLYSLLLCKQAASKAFKLVISAVPSSDHISKLMLIVSKSLLLLLVVVSLANHPARLPLCITELGIRKSHPHLYPGKPRPHPPISCTRRFRTESSVPALCAQSALWPTLHNWIRHPLLSRRRLGACFC